MKQIKTTLYSFNKDKSYNQWKVFVEGDKVIVEFGKIDGKLQIKETICESKNIGRSNETTAEEQAVSEANSKWEKQYRLGYRETVEELQTEEQFSPMLAQDASKKPHLVKYPCYIQPKLDGLRCVVTFDEEGEPVFNSRGNKTYPIQGEIIEQIKTLKKESGFDMFDGEIYLHGLSLQKIVSLAKKWRTKKDIDAEIEKEYLKEYKKWQKTLGDYEPKPEKDVNKYGGFCSDDLEFHIFDIPSDKVWYVENAEFVGWDESESREYSLAQADHIATDENLNKLKFVFGNIVYTEDELKFDIGYYMNLGYEGVIARNFDGKYEFNQRSNDLLKWKLFQSTEAKIVNVEVDKNGEGVLVCADKDGVIVRMKMKGTHAERLYEEMVKHIGEFVTFTYQARTEDNNYQFPVGVAFRKLNPVTWEPLE